MLDSHKKAPLRKNYDLPVEDFLARCYKDFHKEKSGAVADYIPELTKANPEHFGITICTIDGHLHSVGDVGVAFTIQSVSKAFVFALALEKVGIEKVSERIGVEPSGDPFNSIRLHHDSRPYNPMVNAGAIACSGLIYEYAGNSAFDLIMKTLSDFAGRDLTIDENVFLSEKETGHRNRAIAWLLRNNEVLGDTVDDILDIYFKQCSILVTSKDLAIMGATLAANGVNPVTGKRVISSQTAAKTLAIMTSCGMYDGSGEWLYKVGLPAKSGVGGGIVASLPAQVGIGTYSPNLDSVGNSVRGVKVCESLSSFYGLHMMTRTYDVTSCLAAQYNVASIRSSRDRSMIENDILNQQGQNVLVSELGGYLNFVSCDYICRQIKSHAESEVFIFCFRRVLDMSPAALNMTYELFHKICDAGGKVVLASISPDKEISRHFREGVLARHDIHALTFSTLDDAMYWAEDQVIFHYGGFNTLNHPVALVNQPLVQDLSSDQLAILAQNCEELTFRSGTKIISTGAKSNSLYFLSSGMVSITLTSGVQVASLSAGTCFGEFALTSPERPRSADVIADTSCKCLKLSLETIDQLESQIPGLREILLRNLALLLIGRLNASNAKIEILSHY